LRHRGGHVFFFESLKSISSTASIFPSSRFLTSALVRPIDFNNAKTIVELGIGTGVITVELLRRMRSDATLYGIEINPAFVTHVREKIRDPRFVPILGGAERLGSIMNQRNVKQANAIVSSLGLTSMTHEQRSSILQQAAIHLTAEGVLTQYQYLHAGGEPNWSSALGVKRFAEEQFLRLYFREVQSEIVIWNLPPASVFTCRQ
jgi:phospholipid N-methyltransferase